MELLRWYATASRCAAIPPGRMVVHAVSDTRSDVLDFLRAEGVTIEQIEPFDERSPHCNKIAGARKLAAALDGVGTVALTDTDVAILHDPTAIELASRSIAGKIVDLPNPSAEALAAVFEAAGLAEPPRVPIPYRPESTFRGNLNGGLYVLSVQDLGHLADAWGKWALWQLEHPGLLDGEMFHTDQIAMCLAIADLDLHVQALDAWWNLPLHHPDLLPSDPGEPKLLHYHWLLTNTGMLTETGHDATDKAIRRANEAIAETYKEFFPNATFWSWRYSTDPELGSGVGSRGQALEDKRHLLGRIVATLRPVELLDVGCGDGAATAHLAVEKYTGIDLSADAVALARETRPTGDFVVGDPTELSRSAEVVLCLDVLIHQSSLTAYRSLIEWLVDATGRALVVAGYEREPATTSAMISYHEPLSVSLLEADPELELYPLRVAHEITTYLALRRPHDRHPRDFSAKTLADAMKHHPDPLSLVSLRGTAWETVGFLPDHMPRLFEYPIVLDLIRRLVPIGSRIGDVGAGVNPLVPHLHRLGYLVDTIDPSTLIRQEPRGVWNEWGYLDYAARGWAHMSWNCELAQVPSEVLFDMLFSISVIEHLPAADRRALLSDVASRLVPGGELIVTVDVLRGRRALWNRSEGRQVEDAASHGSIDDVRSELEEAGFSVVQSTVFGELGDSPVDIGLFVCHLDGVRTRRTVRPTTSRQSLSSEGIKDPPQRVWRIEDSRWGADTPPLEGR